MDKGDDNGSLILFQDHPAIPSVGTHTLGASVSKTGVIRIYVDGSLEASVTDPSPLPSGDLGLTFGFTGDSGAMRITSFVGRRRSPPQVRIEPVSGSLEVRPIGLALSGGSGPTELQLRVRVDAGGRDLNGQEVNLTLTAVDSSGQGSDGPYGHIHAGVGGLDKPTGKLVPQASVNTGADGLQGLVRYTSSDVSGPIVIRAEIEGALPGSLTIPVGVPGLTSLGGRNSYVLVGDKSWHPRNHWGLPIMVSKLEVLAGGFSAKFGRPIHYNDMSLPFGGVFDVDQNWSSQPNGHVEHRAGRDLDLRTDGTQANGGMTPDQRLWAWNRWESLGGTVWNERLKKDRITPNTKNPHYHFRYRGPA